MSSKIKWNITHLHCWSDCVLAEWIIWRLLSYIDPLGQPKVVAGRIIVFAHVVRPYVRPHFSNPEKQNNRKQCSLLAWLWAGRVDHWRLLAYIILFSSGELAPADLPPIEDLHITVPSAECLRIGDISSVVDDMVVVKAFPNTPAVDMESVLFLDNGQKALGTVFDVFGPVIGKLKYYHFCEVVQTLLICM